MKAYEIGDEVFAIVMDSVETDNLSFKTIANLEANTVIQAKIKSRVERDNDPAKFLYELEDREGTIKASKIYADLDLAKQAVLDSIKDVGIRAGVKKKLDNLTFQ